MIYEDNHLICVYKEPGTPTQEVSTGPQDRSPSARANETPVDLLNLTRSYIKDRYNKPGEVFLAMLHRLDRPVAGPVLFARTSKAASRLSGQFQKRSVTKLYRAIVRGQVQPETGERQDWMRKDESERKAIPAQKGEDGAKSVVLRYRVLQTFEHKHHGPLSHLEIELLTGRFHQVRFQLSRMGNPILGDKKYGAAQGLPEYRIALYESLLEVDHPTTKERLSFTGPCPDFFSSFLPRS